MSNNDPNFDPILPFPPYDPWDMVNPNPYVGNLTVFEGIVKPILRDMGIVYGIIRPLNIPGWFDDAAALGVGAFIGITEILLGESAYLNSRLNAAWLAANYLHAQTAGQSDDWIEAIMALGTPEISPVDASHLVWRWYTSEDIQREYSNPVLYTQTYLDMLIDPDLRDTWQQRAQEETLLVQTNFPLFQMWEQTVLQSRTFDDFLMASATLPDVYLPPIMPELYMEEDAYDPLEAFYHATRNQHEEFLRNRILNIEETSQGSGGAWREYYNFIQPAGHQTAPVLDSGSHTSIPPIVSIASSIVDIPNTPNWLPPIGVSVPSADGRIYAYADGGISPGGLSLVGEEGPELVMLPRGANVVPAPLTQALLSDPAGGGDMHQNVTLNVDFHGTVDSQGARQLVDALERELRYQGKRFAEVN